MGEEQGGKRYRMFIDDTGCVKNIASNHPQQRFGGIVGVIFELDYLRSTFEPGFDRIRERHFGRHDDGRLPTLHLRKMKQPNPKSIFGVLNDVRKRESWERDCYSMYSRAAYQVVAVGVDKVAFYARHPDWSGSIYELLVGNAIERFFYFLRGRGQGDVMAEATNSGLDAELRGLYAKFYEHGTDHIKPDLLRSVLTTKEMKIKPKAPENVGLQVADMLASTCFSHLRQIYAKGPDYSPFSMNVADLIEREKFYRNPLNGNPHGYGRIWRP